MTRATTFFHLVLILAAACLTIGCDPLPPSQEELGRLVFSEAEVPGADGTYTMPERLRSLKTEEAMRREEGLSRQEAMKRQEEKSQAERSGPPGE